MNTDRIIDAGHAMYHGAIVRKLERELAEAREQRDMLAAAMLEMWPFIEEDDYATCNTPAFNAAILKYKQALAAVKGENR
jgi:hypothetical protein